MGCRGFQTGCDCEVVWDTEVARMEKLELAMSAHLYSIYCMHQHPVHDR